MRYNLEEIKNKVYKKFMDSTNLEKQERFAHTIRVMEMAEKIIKSNNLNIDLNKAKIAALIHDYAKFYDSKELLAYAREYKLNCKDFKNNYKVLHALVGPIIIRKELNIYDEDILDAVKYHTTGNEALSPLSMLIYVSDFVEEGRDFFEAKKFREIALKDYIFAGAKISEFTIDLLKKKNYSIHPNTIKMYEYYKNKL
ncbi:MAG: bis(5'-nucleosyl)-tetraphosphatase (symmetrical) YqeK [Bacilli bacterium]|jgi:predicted HD superfamily hydrolase involved in NAD metabolism